MAVLGRLLVASAERLDLPDVLSLDSFTAGDFKYLLKGLFGDEIPYVIKGFDVINPQDAIGSQNISVRVADSVVLYPGSNSGPFFHGLEEGNPNAQPLVPELRKNATNFVYLTLSTFDTARDTRAFWDPDLDGGIGGEFTQDINTESVLRADINVSVASFPENTIPIAIVKVGPAVIESIEDARDMLGRLGTGGINPDPFARYTFRSEPSAAYQRVEPPTEMSSALAPNPFQGADKNFRSLKEWMDVVMTKLAELGGTTFWYEDASTFSLLNIFGDALGKSFRSKGKWDHSSGTPGFLTWTEDIHILGIPDKRDIIIRAGSKALANDEVMYIEFIREQAINTGNVSVDWFNGLNFVNGVVGAFQNLEKGDWIKKASDSNSYYLRVEEFYALPNLAGGVTSAALARSIKLSAPYAGINQTERGRYTKGVYQPSDVQVVARGDIDLESLGGNLSWLAVRQDTIMNLANITPTSLTIDITEADGETAKCESTVAHNLVDGDRVTITGVYAGTYVVEVESADIFYIQTPDLGDDLGVNAFYAVATTTTRSTADGLQLESANHNFKDNEHITIAGTSSSYDDMYQIKVRSATTFSIPIPSAIPMVATGTATLASINVRSEFGMVTLVMGESTDIGGGDTENIRSYVGMKSPSETKPTYLVPPSYNTLDGQANYNGAVDDDLTVRVAKLTAMMADKAQDKTIKLLPHGYESVTNTTNGANQEIVFNPDTNPPPQLEVVLPSSPSMGGTVGLTGTLVLAANQAAWITVDRNDAFTYADLSAVNVSDIGVVPLEENTIVLAVRLNTAEVWLWDGFYVSSGAPVPVPGTLELRVNQNANMKLVRGGTWSWGDLTSYNTLFDNTSPVVSALTIAGTDPAFASRHIPGVNQDLDRVTFLLDSNGPTHLGNLFVDVRADSAGNPGATIATSIAVPRSVVTGNNQLVDFDFAVPVSLTAATTYWITIYTDGAYFGGSTVGVNTNAAGLTTRTQLGMGGPWIGNGSSLMYALYDAVANTLLEWDDDAYIQIPDLPENRNRILAGSVALDNDGDVAYVDVNRGAGAPDDLTINVAQIDSVILGANRIIIARRTDDDVIVGNNSMLLIKDESKKLYAGISDENLAYMGATDAADFDPDYSSTTYIADGDSLTTALGKVDLRLTNLNWKDPVANFAALPAVGNADGDVRLVLDTRVVYTWVSVGAFWREIGFWKAPVADVASLPMTNNADGDVRLVLDTRIPYTWHQATTEWLPVNSTGGGVKITGGGEVSVENGTAEISVFNFDSTNSTSYDLGNYTSGIIVGPTFTPTQDGELTEIDVSVTFVSGTGNLLADIYELNTADFNLAPSSGILATSIPIDITTLPVTLLNPTLTTLQFPPGLMLDSTKMYGVYLYLDTPASAVNFNRNSTGAGPSPEPHVVFKNFDTDNLFHALQGAMFSYNAQTDINVRALVGSSDLHLVFDADMFLEIKGLDYSDNTIESSTQSPIIFTADQQVAYVTPNLSVGGPLLVVTVDDLVNVPADAMIIARRDNGEIIVGSSSTRLKLGQKTELYAQESIQTRNTIRSTDFLRSDEPVTWTGSDLLFTTDIVLEALNTRLGSTELWTIDVSDSPITLADGEVAYIEIDREAGGGTVSPVVSASVPTVTSENIEYVILAKRVDALGAGYLHIPIHKQVLEPGQTVRLGASGSGDGDANTLRGRLEDRLIDSPWELVTPNIFKINKEDLIDGASTGEYSLVSRTFEMPVIGDTFVSVNMLDPDEFLDNDDELRETELMVFWNSDFIDPLATYEVSRNGGLEWQTIDMERVGATELWRGTHIFDEEGSNQVLQQISIASSNADNDLDNGTARQKISQAFVVTNKQLVRTVTLELNKLGAPLGFYKVSIVRDSAGNPSAAIADIMTETALRPLSGLSVGTSTVVHDMPDAVLVPGTYHIVVEADAAYRASYVNGVTELGIRSVTTGSPVSKAYNGTVWNNLASATVYEIGGIALDLRVRITSGTTDVKLDGYGIFYDKAPGQIASGVRNIELFQFSGDLNTTDFLVNNFVVNPEQLKIYDVRTGQVYRYGAFSVDGQTVKFDSGQFYDPGQTITLMFDQTSGGAFDNSDMNGLLLASNHLGSTDASIDRSIAGRGIFLRRPDGTLREIAIDDNDQITVYSV